MGYAEGCGGMGGYDEGETMKPKYYECGICGQWHSIDWDGDCREDAARFNPEDLDSKHGPDGWDEVPMP